VLLIAAIPELKAVAWAASVRAPTSSPIKIKTP
jgi:hypothetical protein